ncbi:MAG: serine/threonine-protein kinase, partial [Chloroflexota bacterium]|nr:serine/threonine-protein kinase [Chloroflexota bacterium]
MTLAAGSCLGPYEIVAPLGAGGMGEVYRARDPRLGREVAIKVLPVAFSADADRLRRFEKEARAASALDHPNILVIHDIGRHESAPYVVSELLEGETLRERLVGTALPARKAIDYGIQIAEGLAAAHEKGIVHRDLKPENLFVMKDGRVKILDFGLAKLTRLEVASGPLTEAPTVTAGTEPGVILGTVGYMSPEQVRGQPADHRSDIFSFGSILYEMLTGRRAFRGDSAIEAMNAILKEEPPELSRPSQDVSPSLQRIVRRCLEKSLEERFQSARDLAFALRETASGSAGAQTAAALPASPSRPILWYTSLGIAVVVLLVVLIAINAGGLRERLRGRATGPRIQSLAVLPLENFSRDPEQDYFADGMTDALITDLAQIGALRVISRTSVMRYKGTKKSLREIGRELNVEGLVEGSVVRAGDRVRITAQLI